MRSLPNCLHNQMCVIDTETTNIDPDLAEIWQLAIIPIDSKLNRIPDAHLYIDIKPLTTEPPHKKAAMGLMPEAAVEVFTNWVEDLDLLPGKKIIPIGHNYAMYDSKILKNWLGPLTYAHYFSHRIRDTMLIAAYLLDHYDYHLRDSPFGKSLELSACCQALGIEVNEERTHDALYDALITSQLYKKLISLGGDLL